MSFWNDINPFDDEGGAFQGSEPGWGGGPLAFLDGITGAAAGGGGAKAPKRGEARSGGQDPNRDNFNLNWDPSGAQNINNYAAGVGERAMGMGGQAADYNAQSEAAGRRGLLGADQRMAQGDLHSAARRGAQQAGVAGALGDAAGRTTGDPAQAVRQQGTNDAMNSALAIAASGGGFGGSAATQAQAMNQAPAEIARQANDAARLSAESEQADAARQIGALQSQAGVLGQARGQDVESAALARQLGLDPAQLQMQGMSMNDQLRLGLGGLGLGYDQAAIEGQLGAGQLGLGAQNTQLQGALGQMQGSMAYEQLLNDLYGIDVTGQQGSRALDQQNSMNWVNGIAGVGSAIGGLAALSDRRAKQNIKTTRLSERYAALSGGM